MDLISAGHGAWMWSLPKAEEAWPTRENQQTCNRLRPDVSSPDRAKRQRIGGQPEQDIAFLLPGPKIELSWWTPTLGPLVQLERRE